jgi:hypothetical protein
LKLGESEYVTQILSTWPAIRWRFESWICFRHQV